MLTTIWDFLGVTYFWVKLNIQGKYEKENYVKFTKLLKGAGPPWSSKPNNDPRPYTETGGIIFFILIIALLIFMWW